MTVHGPDCSCTRCAGFQPGNELRFREGNDVSVRHGAYAVVKLGPRAAEIADALRRVVPAASVADEPSIRLAGLMLARLERACDALDGASPEELRRLESDARGWANSAARLLDRLGCTPTARARMGLDVARIRATEEGLDELREQGRRAIDQRGGGA